MILIEENFRGLGSVIKESTDGKKKLYLKGIFAEAEQSNQNGRTYDLAEMIAQVKLVNEKAALGRYVLGELDHPSNTEIKLANVSHKITEMWMEGNNAMGKAEIIEGHPNGQILKALIEAGINVGVSTRGTGQVNESTGRVAGFTLITVDAVATPSARSAYPETIEEQLQMDKRGTVITDLSESVIHDSIAQKYFQMEIKKFIDRLGMN